VTDLVLQADQFEQLAWLDGMTGLFNRQRFLMLAAGTSIAERRAGHLPFRICRGIRTYRRYWRYRHTRKGKSCYRRAHARTFCNCTFRMARQQRCT
jgi:hypothetical protein